MYYQQCQQLLLNAGADVNTGDGTALLHAINIGDTRLVSKLLEVGADVNKGTLNSYTSLILAVRQCDLSTVSRLLRSNACVNLRSKDGKNCLQMSMRHGMVLYAAAETTNEILSMPAHLRFGSDEMSLRDICREKIRDRLLPSLYSTTVESG